MNQIGNRKKRTINGNALRTWALLFLLAGILGRGLIQNHILGVGSLTTQQLLEVMGSSRQAMTMATASLVHNPTDCSLPGSSVQGIIQARILEWAAMPSFRGSS